MKAELFTRENIDLLDWPSTPDGDYARRYLLPMMTDGPQKYIRNVYNTQVMIAKVEDTILPITATDFHLQNTYTCSPYSHYISYGGFEEVQRLNNPLAESLIRLILHPVAWYFRHSGFDRVALVNNWLLSTNLYPSITAARIEVLMDALPDWFPDRAIVFRSVDNFKNPVLFDILQKHGYRMVLSRQVWYQNPEEAVHVGQFKEDVRTTKKNGYDVSEILEDHELRRALDLYELLYLKKYSYFNPQFTAEFLRLARDKKLLTFRTLRRDGKPDGMLGYFIRNGAMTQPMFGYDTNLSAKEGLYRMLSVLTMQEGLRHHLLIHASAGVGKFKKLRGGKQVIEYNAVFYSHLPPHRQMPWKIMQWISNAAIPIFQKNDF